MMMQIGSLVPRALTQTAKPAPQAPAAPSNDQPPTDGVDSRPSWTESAFGKLTVNVGRSAGLAAVFPAVGALAAQAGSTAFLVGLAGSAGLGAYAASKSDLGNSTYESCALGAGLATMGYAFGGGASGLGGVEAGLLVAGTLGATGAFRGVLETASEYNLV